MSRELEREWRKKHSNLRYCSKHQRYYDESFGCQQCFLEKTEEDLKEKVVKAAQLQVCPKCKQKSLFWNEKSKLFECSNLKCLEVFAQTENKEQSQQTRAVGNEYFDPTDKKRKKPKRKLFPFGK